MSEQSTTRSVTVVGLGPMGRAMVRAFLDAGVEVTVWNRSADKVDAMVELGAKRAATVAEALDANEVTVLSLTHYAAMYDVLGQATDHLPGKVIANLSSDSPETARKGAAWAREHGAEFITGGVMSAGDNIVHPALLTIFHPWLLAFDQATAVIERSGHSVAQFIPFAVRSNAAFPYFMEEHSVANQNGGWADLASLKMMDAGAQHVIDASEEVGVDATFFHVALEFWRKAIAASEEKGAAVSTYALMRGQP